MTAAAAVAIVAALAAVAALVATYRLYGRTRAQAGALDREIARGRAKFDEIVATEADERAAELERTLARARAESLSALAADERRIAEERRREVVEREREAGVKLAAALAEVQQDVEQRLANWASDVETLQSQLAVEQQRIEQRQAQLRVECESRLEKEGERLQAGIDEHRMAIARAREDAQRATKVLVDESAAELELHAAERRHALHELDERLRQRERELEARVERDQADAVQRVTEGLPDVGRQQVEQLRRTVSNEATRYAEAAAVEFETTIRTAREEAARRLRRELDLAVERFAREADGVLAERVDTVARGAVQQVEGRLSTGFDALERQRDETLDSFESRVQEIEAGLRDRLREIASEAEAERELLERRLRDLMRRLDELAARA
jgi:hypothetical protein